MAKMTSQERADLRKKAFAALKKGGCLTAHIPLDGGDRPDIEVISTGSLVLDKLLCINGWPRGRIVEIFGPESVGKSTLAIAACIEVQRQNGFAVFIDFEHAVDLGYAQAMGLDLSEECFAFFQPDHFEMGERIAYEMITVMKADIVVIDSVSTMIPRKVFESGPDGGATVGLQARLMSTFLNMISKEITKTGTVLFFCNQMRTNIKMSKYDAGPDWSTSGGKALPYYCSVRLRLRPGKVEYANIVNELTGEKEKIPVSNFVRAESHKNKVGIPKRKGEFVIRYGEGIDNTRSIIMVAERHKIIKKGGAWYSFRKEGEIGYFKRQGVEQVRKYLQEHPEIFRMMMVEVKDKLATYEVKKISSDLTDDDIYTEERMDAEDMKELEANRVSKELDGDDDDDLETLVNADTPSGLLSLDDLDDAVN